MTRMDIITVILFLFLCFRFFRLVIKMKQPAIFPVTEEDLQAIRILPKKAVELPIISHQKTGLKWLGLTVLFLLIVVVFDLLSGIKDFSYAIIPLMALFNFNQLCNLFAIVEKGVLCGGRFVPWKSIQSYHFEEMDKNHRFYGSSSEVNNGYELWITTKFSEVSCIVTSEAVKEKFAGILDAQLKARKRFEK